MAADRPRSALYARLQEILRVEHADTLMTYLPPQPPDELATKAGLEELKDRFDRLDEHIDRLHEAMHQQSRTYTLTAHQQLRTYTLTTVGAMTALTAIYTGLLTIVT